jgi:diadenosine tetraphosphate (Ap4A) HIT family hydrolase
MYPFTLDSQLQADTLVLGQLPLCRALLLDDSRYPWLVLVPARDGLTEIIDLDSDARVQLMHEMAAACEVLKAIYNPDKLNVGALGNRVRQLHVHVIARFVSDEAWPQPVWGVGQARPYPPHMAGVIMDQICEGLMARGMKVSEC